MSGSRLHAEIMNTETAGDILGRIEVSTVGNHHARELSLISKALGNLSLGEELSQMLILAYKIGHRDAVDEASEKVVEPLSASSLIDTSVLVDAMSRHFSNPPKLAQMYQAAGGILHVFQDVLDGLVGHEDRPGKTFGKVH